MLKTGIIIQARLGSSRLPEKMLLPFFGSKGILQILLENIISTATSIPIVLATTTSIEDDRIEVLGKELGIVVYRGSEEDVLDRFIQAASLHGFTRIIRVCGDNPFLDMNSLKELINLQTTSSVDYVGFATSKGTPTIKTHYGFWAEAVSLKALKRAFELARDKFFHEHLTTYIFSNPDLFRIHFINIPVEFEKLNLRMTVDTQNDFLLLKEIFSEYKNIENSDLHSLVRLVSTRGDWLEIMEKEINKNEK